MPNLFDDSEWGRVRQRGIVVQPRRVDGMLNPEVQCWNCGTWVNAYDAAGPCLSLDGASPTIFTGFPGKAAFMAPPLFCDRTCLRTKLDDLKLDKDADEVAAALNDGDQGIIELAEFREARAMLRAIGKLP